MNRGDGNMLVTSVTGETMPRAARSLSTRFTSAELTGRCSRACPPLRFTLKSRPSTRDSRASVDTDGSCSPDSSRAMFGCRIPSSRASADCDRPRSARYFTTMIATSFANRVRSYSAAYSGSSRM